MKLKMRGELPGFILHYGLLIIFTPIMLFLMYYNFRYSQTAVYLEYGRTIIDTADSMALHCLTIVIWIIVALLLGKIIDRTNKKERFIKCLLWFVMVITFLACLGWNVFGNFYSMDDSRTVLSCMESLRNGDYSVLQPEGYIGAYKQHLGLMTLFNLIFKITGTTNEFAVRMVNIICVPVIVYSGYGILKELISEYKIYIYYCMFMLFCFPIFLYTPYVYGEVISNTAGMIFIWSAICWIKRQRIGAWITLLVCSVVGFMARSNFMILLIAFAIMTFLYTIKKRKVRIFICTISLFIALAGTNTLNRLCYEHISGVKIDQGVPIVAWIAMGLNEYSELGVGSYDGYNIATYANCDYNTEAAKAECMPFIRDRVRMFVGGIGRSAFSFFKEKALIQWNDPTVNCFMENRNFIPDPLPIIGEIVVGEYYDEAKEVMNQYHCLLYLGVLIYCIKCFMKKVPFYELLIMIILLGGFLFTLIWESMSRYVLPYIVYMVPLAAIGWYSLHEWWATFLKKLKSLKNAVKNIN